MRMLATTEQMRELDRTAIEERGIPSLELMENAAREVAQAVADLVGPVKGPRPDGRIGGAVSVAVLTSRGEPLTPEEQREADEIRAVVESKNSDLTQRIALFCGPGNNGGDGIAAARLLREWGYRVRAFLVGDRTKMTPDARAMEERLAEAGGALEPLDLEDRLLTAWLSTCDCYVDADVYKRQAHRRPLGQAAHRGHPALHRHHRLQPRAVQALQLLRRIPAIQHQAGPHHIQISTGIL